MLASVSLVLGILIAAIILTVTRRPTQRMVDSAPKPTLLGWITLGFGLIATMALVLGMSLSSQPNDAGLGAFLLSIALGFAAVVISIGAIIRRELHWLTWVGLAIGLFPAIFWIIFLFGNIFGGG
jgi:hypothetical protein